MANIENQENLKQKVENNKQQIVTTTKSQENLQAKVENNEQQIDTIAKKVEDNKQKIDAIVDKIYPIGSIYMSMNATSPSTLFGGTWKSIGAGRVLQGADDAHAAGTTIEAGLPNITGGFAPWSEGAAADITQPVGAFYKEASNQYGWGTVNGRDQDNAYMRFDASRCSAIYGKSDTVQPPALAVYIWQRTA